MRRWIAGLGRITASLIAVVILGIAGYLSYIWYQSANDAPASKDTASDKNATYLVLKEWKTRIKLTEPGAYYTVTNAGSQDFLTVYSAEADKMAGPKGISCKGEYVAYLKRLPADEISWNSGANAMFAPRKIIGKMQYAVTTYKQKQPACFNKGTEDNYVADPTTSARFNEIAAQFVTDFKTIQSD